MNLQASMMLEDTEQVNPVLTNTNTSTTKNTDDIMSVLLQHEKRGGQSQSSIAAASLKQAEESSDSSGEEPDQMGIPDFCNPYAGLYYICIVLFHKLNGIFLVCNLFQIRVRQM